MLADKFAKKIFLRVKFYIEVWSLFKNGGFGISKCVCDAGCSTKDSNPPNETANAIMFSFLRNSVVCWGVPLRRNAIIPGTPRVIDLTSWYCGWEGIPKIGILIKKNSCFAETFFMVYWNGGQKIEILLNKNQNFGQNTKLWTKIEILNKNRNCGQKSKFWTKIKILDKNRNFEQKSKFWTKIEILDKNVLL